MMNEPSTPFSNGNNPNAAQNNLAAVPPITRAEINRQNSQHSTGPKTPEGKEKVSCNALKHGLYSTATLLPGEDQEAYDALGRMLAESVKPGCPEEVYLLKIVQDLDWQLIRTRALDANYYALTLERELPQFADKEPAAQQAYASAAAFEKNARLFNQISRQQARLTNQRKKAIAEYFEAQAARKEQAEAIAAAEQARLAAEQQAAAPPVEPDAASRKLTLALEQYKAMHQFWKEEIVPVTEGLGSEEEEETEGNNVQQQEDTLAAGRSRATVADVDNIPNLTDHYRRSLRAAVQAGFVSHNVLGHVADALADEGE